MAIEPEVDPILSSAWAHHAADPFRLLVESVKDYAIFLLDLTGKIISWNPGAERLFGYPKNEILGQSFSRLYRPEDVTAGKPEQTLQATLNEGRREVEGWRVRKDGSPFWVHAILTALSDRSGQVWGVAKIVRDLTERKRAEESLRASERRLRLALDAGRMGMWAWDLSTNQSHWNRIGYELLGLTPTEGPVDPELFFQHVHPDDLPGVRQAVSEALENGTELEREFRVVRADGEIRWLAGRGQIVRDEATSQPLQMLGIAHDVTERKWVEEELRIQQLRIQMMLDQVQAVLWSTDRELHFTYGSGAGLRALGLKPGQLVGQTLFEFFRTDDPTFPPIASHLQTLQGKPCHYEMEWADRHYQVLLEPMRDEHDGVVGCVGIALDVTERKQAEEHLGALADELRTRLRQQEAVAQLGQMAVSSPDLDEVLNRAVAILAEVLDVELCKVLELQSDGQTLLLRAGIGWREGLVGRATVGAGADNQAGYTLASDQPVIVDDLGAETRFSGPALLHEHRVVSGMTVGIRGRDRLFGVLGTHSTRRRAFTANDVVFLQGIANILANAVERKRLETLMVQESELTTTMMEALPGLVGLADDQMRLIRWNKALEKVSGFTADEIARMSPLDFIAREDQEALAAEIQAALRTGRGSVEGHVRTKDGNKIPYFFSGVRVTNEKGTFLLGVGIDISERKRLEQQYRQAQKMEALGQLAGGVAHDFNNLFTIINGYSDLLIGRFPSGDPTREVLTEIQKAGERAASLTRQLLAFSRRQVLEPKVLNLNAVVGDTEKMLRRLVGEDVILTTALDPALGPVKADPGQLEQVLINLVINARDAMPQGGKLTIETQNVELDESFCRVHPGLRPGPYALLAVTDTGMGMDEATRSHLFEPFFTTKGLGKGTGLGLATVHGIVQQSGGHVEAYSELGMGTTFKVFLPQVQQPVSPGKSRQGSISMPRGSETILLVDDEDAVRSLGRQCLRACGYSVLEAKDGQEALQIVEGHRGTIDLLVSDVVMPRLGGRQLAERVTALRPACKVLFLSGYTDDAVVRHGVVEAEYAFLQKPYTPAALAQKVREVLDQKG
jgi:PAS domain S-box-containing protein